MNMQERLIEELTESNRLMRSFLLTHQDINRAALMSPARIRMTALDTAERWAEKYGECVKPVTAARIIDRVPGSITNWVSEGRIIQYPTGMIDTYSLAFYMVTGEPQGNVNHDPLQKMRRPSMGKDALETITYSRDDKQERSVT